MNYRHRYHAGNFGDVFKHAILALLLEHLTAKDKPICYLDTHAGAGRYDLATIAAGKTGEWRGGALKVMALSDPPAALTPYLSVLRRMNPAGGVIRWYPGSPWLARELLREQDRLLLVELHPEDARVLTAIFADDRRARVHPIDGYVALKSFLPPSPRRGLVLIDPPFETTDEFARIVRGLAAAHRRWATGVFAIWYPIKHRAPIETFHRDLVGLGIPNVIAAELWLRPPQDAGQLNGCGMVIVNPPWRFDVILGELLPALRATLSSERGAGAQAMTLSEPLSKKPARAAE